MEIKFIKEVLEVEGYSDGWYKDARVTVMDTNGNIWLFIQCDSCSGWIASYTGISKVVDGKVFLKDWKKELIKDPNDVDIDIEEVDLAIRFCKEYGLDDFDFDDLDLFEYFDICY